MKQRSSRYLMYLWRKYHLYGIFPRRQPGGGRRKGRGESRR